VGALVGFVDLVGFGVGVSVGSGVGVGVGSGVGVSVGTGVGVGSGVGVLVGTGVGVGSGVGVLVGTGVGVGSVVVVTIVISDEDEGTLSLGAFIESLRNPIKPTRAQNKITPNTTNTNQRFCLSTQVLLGAFLIMCTPFLKSKKLSFENSSYFLL
jgi:hypothetical protein